MYVCRDIYRYRYIYISVSLNYFCRIMIFLRVYKGVKICFRFNGILFCSMVKREN